MPRKSSHFPLVLPARDRGVTATRWLYAAVRAGILEGRLRPETRVPSTRELGRSYGLSRGTIIAAFDQLKSEGYLEAKVGSGTYVSRILPDRPLRAAPTPVRLAATRGPARRLAEYGRRVRRFPNFTSGPIRAFRTDQPALDLFPTALWAQVSARRLRQASMDLLLACPPAGYPPLQEAIADYLATSRGVTCTPEQVVIVSGVQEALDLAGRLFLDPGDRVAVENPGYPGATLAFEAHGATVVPLEVDGEGPVLGDPRLSGTRLAYVTPAHQFPLGAAMSLPRRLALLDWARERSVVIFEDDYDSEFRYSGHPVPALQGLDRHGQVLFAGSFSKVLFPSLRLGYMVVPPDLLDVVAAALSTTIRHAPLLQQAIVADFIAGGHFGRHVRRMREVYAERLGELLACAADRLGGLLEISGVEAGLQTTGWLQRGIDAEEAATAAARREVEITPLSRYAHDRVRRGGIHLGFAAVDTREIRRGVSELALALEGVTRLPAREKERRRGHAVRP